VFLSRSSLVMILSAALIVPSAFASRVHRAPTSGKAKTSSKSKTGSKNTARSTTSTEKANGLATAKARNQSTKRHKAIKRKASRRVRGQQSIDSERATQIQQALIREHYLSGVPSGMWDASSMAAMQKYQADQGWQTKLMPDSRALKKLGLGPDYSSAINAKDSSFAPPPESTIPTEQASGFAAAAGVNQ
jgi:hypothetical protein